MASFKLNHLLKVPSLSFFVFTFWLHRAAGGILVPQPGIQPAPPAVEAWSLNHWAAREVPKGPISKYNPILRVLGAGGVRASTYEFRGT